MKNDKHRRLGKMPGGRPAERGICGKHMEPDDGVIKAGCPEIIDEDWSQSGAIMAALGESREISAPVACGIKAALVMILLPASLL